MSASIQAVQAPSQEGRFVSFPDSPFQLYQPYPPAGDQPSAIAQLVEGVQDGEEGPTLFLSTGTGDLRVTGI